MIERLKSFTKKHKKFLALVTILIFSSLLVWKIFLNKPSEVHYQTAIVRKGNISSFVSGSGQVALTGRAPVVTEATGMVSEVFVKNGDQVSAGQKIVSIDLDQSSIAKNAGNWSSYLGALSSLNMAKANMLSSQGDMFTNWQKFLDLAKNSTYQNADGSPNDTNRTSAEFNSVKDKWLAAEATYQNQKTEVGKSQAALSSAWLTYQQGSPDILAPVSGIIGDITITPGMVISKTSATGDLSQTLAVIKSDTVPKVSVNLSETDVNNVKEGDKVTLNIDALPDKSFTGVVAGVNRTGIIDSGVTNFPATISLDSENSKILPNMSVTANIITDRKKDVLIIPSEAVQSRNGSSFVRVMKNGQIQRVIVKVGISSDTETEITDGLSEGDKIVIGASQDNSEAANPASSPFNSSFRFGGGGGRFRQGGGR